MGLLITAKRYNEALDVCIDRKVGHVAVACTSLERSVISGSLSVAQVEINESMAEAMTPPKVETDDEAAKKVHALSCAYVQWVYINYLLEGTHRFTLEASESSEEAGRISPCHEEIHSGEIFLL